jgi:hypothetical protein
MKTVAGIHERIQRLTFCGCPTKPRIDFWQDATVSRFNLSKLGDRRVWFLSMASDAHDGLPHPDGVLLQHQIRFHRQRSECCFEKRFPAIFLQHSTESYSIPLYSTSELIFVRNHGSMLGQTHAYYQFQNTRWVTVS